MYKFFFLLSALLFSAENAQAQSCQSLDADPLYGHLLQNLRNKNLNCSGSIAHLTFDDGPNTKTTEKILNALNKRNVKATFFVTTTNLHPNSKDLAQKQAIVRKQLSSGHLIASHGHEHNSYDLRMGANPEPGYNYSQRDEQIRQSVTLLDQATNGAFSRQPQRLFRFPYGRGAIPSQAEINEMERTKKMTFTGKTYSDKLKEYRRQSPALHQLAEHGFSHLGWNHDSKDSSLPTTTMPDELSLRNYVVENMEELCSPNRKVKISLYHDIKEVNTRAIPLIVDLGKCLGVQFASPQAIVSYKQDLTNSGVIISHLKTQSAPLETFDEIGALLKTLNGPKAQCNDQVSANTNTTGSRSTCYSEYLKKEFSNCQGVSSICFDGKWYDAKDPFITLNCAL